MSFQKLYIPENEIELAILKSLLEAENIHYYVDNEGFGSLYVGLRGSFLAQKTVLVHEADFDRAQELLKDFLARKRLTPID